MGLMKVMGVMSGAMTIMIVVANDNGGGSQ